MIDDKESLKIKDQYKNGEKCVVCGDKIFPLLGRSGYCYHCNERKFVKAIREKNPLNRYLQCCNPLCQRHGFIHIIRISGEHYGADELHRKCSFCNLNLEILNPEFIMEESK